LVKAAAKVLDPALEEPGIDRIDRADVYLTNVTNVVKHFKWAASVRGKRRIHQKPRLDEIEACRRWLDSELRIIQPQVLVCLGATANSTFGNNSQMIAGYETQAAQVLLPEMHIHGANIRFRGVCSGIGKER